MFAKQVMGICSDVSDVDVPHKTPLVQSALYCTCTAHAVCSCARGNKEPGLQEDYHASHLAFVILDLRLVFIFAHFRT
jgi:hypothetical protein